MKKLLPISALTLVTTSALADNMYLKLGAGHAHFNNIHRYLDNNIGTISRTNNTGAGEVALGFAAVPDVRTDLSVYFASGNRNRETALIGDGRVTLKRSVTAYMLNGYHDFDSDTPVKPYITVGLGAARLRFKGHAAAASIAGDDIETLVTQEASHSKTKFAYSGGVGFNYNMSQNVSLDLGYKYIGANRVRMWNEDNSARVTQRTNIHNVMLGLKFAL